MELKYLPNRIKRAAHYAFDWARSPRPPGATDDQEYADFLKGKRVVLVGPAPTVVGSRQADSIEGFDRVIRINHALPVPADLREDVGSRTDILYHNVWKNSPKAIPFSELVPILLDTVQWVCTTCPYSNAEEGYADLIDAFQAELKGRLPFRAPDARAYIPFKWGMRCQPNAGITAIHDLLRFDIAELYITGFTFYQGGGPYYDGYKGVGLIDWSHPPDKHIRQLRRFISADTRIRTDEALEAILFPET